MNPYQTPNYTGASDYYPGCQCAPVEHGCADNLRYWLSLPKVTIGPDVKALLFTREECGAISADLLHIKIRRRGTPEYCLQYPHFDTDDDGRFRFILDAKLFALGSGRYEATVFQGDRPCSTFEIKLSDKCTISTEGISTTEGKALFIKNGEIPNVTNIFDSINEFNATTCAVMEADATALPLSTADAAALCALVLCRPVELVIGDGIKTETVLFTACVGGVPAVTRGVAGTSPARFPSGSTVAFSWTATNVTAACEGCI